jgi:hypothetical protein
VLLADELRQFGRPHPRSKRLHLLEVGGFTFCE